MGVSVGGQDATNFLLISKELSAKAKRAGVTWFTRLSVHWADKRTATSDARQTRGTRRAKGGGPPTWDMVAGVRRRECS